MSINLISCWKILFFQPFVAPVPTFLRPVAGAHLVDKSVKCISLNICYVFYVLLWIKYLLVWFESFLLLILFKFKKHPNISGIRIVYVQSMMTK